MDPDSFLLLHFAERKRFKRHCAAQGWAPDHRISGIQLGEEIRIKVGEFPQVIPFELVQLIQFDSAGPAASSTAPPPLQTFPKTATLPSDTKLTIRMSDRIDSKTPTQRSTI